MEDEGTALKARFDALKKDKKISRAEFARRYNVPGGDTMIYQHISGLKPISMEAGLAYAKGFGCSLAEISARLDKEASRLTMLVGTTDTGYAVNVEPVQAERQQYPIISWVQAGAWRQIVDAYPRGWGESMVFAQNQHGALTFALKVMGDSMEPEFREGDVIFVDPDKEPKAGSYVVAKNHEEEATFKKYRSRGKDAEGREVFELVPLNENYATLRSDQEPITIIGVVVEHTRVFKV